MGKIRVRTLGIDEIEKKQKKESKQKAKEKKLVKVPGKGGERIVAVLPSEKELAAATEAPRVEQVPQVLQGDRVSPRGTGDTRKPRGIQRSSKYQAIAKLVDKTKTYSLKEALEMLPKIHLAKFDETVELHINTIDKGISATATLPHGTGKKVRVAIADDLIIEDVSQGKINFDVLLAEPSFMPKLARIAKFLGPRGLMPNPKSGTISTNPKELAKKYEGGQITFKTEAKFPVMHLIVGKMSLGEKKLAENIKAAFDVVKPENIKNVTLKSTMSPGIKIQLVKLD